MLRHGDIPHGTGEFLVSTKQKVPSSWLLLKFIAAKLKHWIEEFDVHFRICSTISGVVLVKASSL